jgi:hypothetical protein
MFQGITGDEVGGNDSGAQLMKSHAGKDQPRSQINRLESSTVRQIKIATTQESPYTLEIRMHKRSAEKRKSSECT